MKNHHQDSSKPKFVDTYGCSRTGEDRHVNGDQFMVAELRRAATVHHASQESLDDTRRFGANQAHVMLVADGVSGQDGAPRASRLVVDEVMESILNAVPWSQELDVDSEAHLRKELKDTVVRCNEHVADAAERAPEKSDMASTLTMAFVRWPNAFVVHAGDSRAYLLRDGEIERLTTDHTFAQQMIEDGELEASEAETSKFAHVLWNAVGGDHRVTPELTMRTLKPGDALLLCSDGLTKQLSDGAIRHMVETQNTARAACEQMVEAVSSLGGGDDVTVALARFDEAAESAARTRAEPAGGAERRLEIPTPPPVPPTNAIQVGA